MSIALLIRAMHALQSDVCNVMKRMSEAVSEAQKATAAASVSVQQQGIARLLPPRYINSTDPKSDPTPTENMCYGERNNVPVVVPGLHRGAERTKAFPRYPDCHAFNWGEICAWRKEQSQGLRKLREELESGCFVGTAQNM